MIGIKYVAEKMEEYTSRDSPIHVTPRRMRELRTFLKETQQMVQLNSKRLDEYGLSDFNPTRSDVEAVGRMEFLLNGFFPDEKVPESLQKYAQFIQKVKYFCRDDYDEIIEDKLRRDEKVLNAARIRGDTLDEIDDSVYARTFVNIVDAEKVRPERSKLIVIYGGDPLYEENLPEDVFEGLPQGATVVFNYTKQMLTLDLEKTLEASSSTTKRTTDVEGPVISALAKDTETKKYIDDVFDQINSS